MKLNCNRIKIKSIHVRLSQQFTFFISVVNLKLIKGNFLSFKKYYFNVDIFIAL